MQSLPIGPSSARASQVAIATLADEGRMGSESIEPSGRKNIFGEGWLPQKINEKPDTAV
jgi:hypothetical protein